MVTPALQLRTLFALDSQGRILAAQEPGAPPGPLLSIVRNEAQCVWAVGVEVPSHVAEELDHLLAAEPPIKDLRTGPINAGRYVSILQQVFGSGIKANLTQSDGPAFTFPRVSTFTEGRDAQVVLIDDDALIQSQFAEWETGEIVAGRAPVFAILEDGRPVSMCFCARRSTEAAEAGLETLFSHRGRGFGTRVAAAWSQAVRESGRVPLYSTSWSNAASLAVAQKLRLEPYACDWSISR